MRDLNELGYFAAVVQHGGFTAAERATGIPKSTLSKGVAKLEQRLQSKLLERSTRRFRVTDLGLDLYRHCLAMLESADAAESVIAQAHSEPQGIVRVSSPQPLLEGLVAESLPEFLLRYPKVQIELRVVNRRVDLIEEGIDIALRARERIDAEGSLVARPLGSTKLVLVASPAFLQRNPVTRLEDIEALPTLALELHARTPTWEFIGSACDVRSVAHRPVLVSGDSAPLLKAALHGIGLALLPQHVCRPRLQAGELVEVLPEWTMPTDIVHAVFTTRKGLRPSVRVLIDHLVESVQELLGGG